MNSFLHTTGLLSIFPKIVQILFLGFLALKTLDFITGSLKVLKNGGYKSSKMREGLIKFVAELVSVTFVIILDMIMGLDFYLTGITLSYVVYKEAGSITENLGEIGVHLPPQLAEKIEVLNPENKGDNKNE